MGGILLSLLLLLLLLVVAFVFDADVVVANDKISVP